MRSGDALAAPSAAFPPSASPRNVQFTGSLLACMLGTDTLAAVLS